jgi:uncharacterized protein YdaU (DUF1376 family)
MHYYQFHIGDYKSHTHHLSLIEDLAYRRLLDHYYLHQTPIKQRDIARQIGMRDHEQDVLTVLEEFFVSTDDGYINPRADKEIKAFVEHQATSAYGAFVRTNPELKNIASKQLFIEHYISGSIADYVSLIRSSCVVDVPMICTPSDDDATNSQYTIPNTHKPVVDAPPVGKSKGKRLSPDWQLPKAWGEWTLETMGWETATVRLEAEKFRDYWVAISGRNAARLDWEATWRNWCRNAKVQANPQTSLLAGGI